MRIADDRYTLSRRSCCCLGASIGRPVLAYAPVRVYPRVDLIECGFVGFAVRRIGEVLRGASARLRGWTVLD